MYVLSIKLSGKAHQVAREMSRLGIVILGVSETRWTGTGKVQLVSGEMGCINTVKVGL